MSEVLYARVPDSLKQSLQQHAAERALSLTATVVELLEHGLRAGTQEAAIAELERTLALAHSDHANTQARLQQTELHLQAAHQHEQTTAHIYQALAERARHELALCPRCRAPLHGDDLLVRGRCPRCGKTVTTLLLPPRGALIDNNDYLTLLGALGGLIALALTNTP